MMYLKLTLVLFVAAFVGQSVIAKEQTQKQSSIVEIKGAATHKEVFDLLVELKLEPAKRTPSLEEVKDAHRRARGGIELSAYYEKGFGQYVLQEQYINEVIAENQWKKDEEKVGEVRLPNPRVLGHLNPEGPVCGAEIKQYCDSKQGADAFYCLYENRTAIYQTDSGKECLSFININVPEVDRKVAQQFQSVSQIR
jgi:hypothetical protein